MRIRTLALHLFIVAAALPAVSPAVSAAATDPSALITDLGMQLRQVLVDDTLTASERQQRLRGVIDAGFDFQTISRFVLGRYWQTSNEAFRREFSVVFEDYVIHSLSGRFGEYSGESINVTATRPEGADNTIVSTAIIHPNGAPPAKVDWRVLNTKAGFKITDVSVSGISLALSYREQFASVINRDGGQTSSLISEMREKLSGTANDSAPGSSSTRGVTP